MQLRAGTPTVPMVPAARERRRPLASSPGGGRHRYAKRSERRGPRSRPDDAERRGSGREANHPRTRGPSLPPACGGLCRPEVGVPLPARHSAWWRRAETCTIQRAAFSCRRGVRDHPIMGFLPVGAGIARWKRAKPAEFTVLAARGRASRSGTCAGTRSPPRRPDSSPGCGRSRSRLPDETGIPG